MIYPKLLSFLFRCRYGEVPEVAEGDASGLVLVAGGVGGARLCEMGLRHVVGRGDGALLVRPVSWGHGFGRWHADLTDVANHRAQAVAIAAQVVAWRDRYPGTPVTLVGKSGGCGIVVKALEELPDDSVGGAVLLAPAVSPGYDLSRALRAVRGEMVVFWSPLDAVVLGAGTCLFKTTDRVRSVSAGMVGFRPPASPDGPGRSPYNRLRQVRWGPGTAASGHLGGHVGPDNPAFLRKYVVPLLIGATAPEMLNFPRDQGHPMPRR